MKLFLEQRERVASRFHIRQEYLLQIPYSRKIWRGFKFGSLAVGIETAKLKSANIMLAAPAMRKT